MLGPETVLGGANARWPCVIVLAKVRRARDGSGSEVACKRGRVREVGSARECPVRFAWRERESEGPGRASSRCAKGREGSRRGLELRENAKKVGVRARGSSASIIAAWRRGAECVDSVNN